MQLAMAAPGYAGPSPLN